MKRIIALGIILLIISSCVSLPSSSITLTKKIVEEAENMHQLNITLVNKLFEERLEKINLFFENKYIPTLIKKYEKLIPDNVDYQKELPNIIGAIVPVINKKKDSVTGILRKQNLKIISELNNNYSNYTNATSSLQNLIVSVVKVKNVENDVLLSIEKLTGTDKDVKKVKTAVESFLNKTNINLDNIIE